MFENAKWIRAKECADNAPLYYFCDLNVIYPLRKATLTLTAGGVYEAFVGKERVGKDILAPGFTEFEKHHMYQTYDITSLVAESDFLTVRVGAGWYCGRIARLGRTWTSSPDKSAPSVRPLGMALIAQIDLEFAGGLSKTIVTDESWLCGKSDVLASDIYDGEIFDARILPNADEPVVVLDGDKTQLAPAIGVPVREHEVFVPKAVFYAPNGELVVDFGVNLTGYVFFEDLKAHAGEEIVLSHGEILDKDGNFYNANYRSAKACLRYICREGAQSYRPHHTFFGFRYVRIDAFPKDADPKALRAVAVYSDMKRSGTFDCGDTLVSQLYENTLRGQKGNFLDVPTDCPQRDERLGWTGDAEIFCRTALYNFDGREFFRKWLCDMAFSQKPDGSIPHTVPDIVPGSGAAAWGDAAVIVPWTLYVMYGDKSILRDALPMMTKWVEFLCAWGENAYLVEKHQQFGDWLALDRKDGKKEERVGATNVDYIAAVYYANAADILAKSLDALGEDGSGYHALHDRIIEEIRKGYFPLQDTQTAQVLALKFGVCRDDEKQAVADTLAALIREAGDSLTTGFVGTPYLLEVLSDNGYADLAYTLLLRKEYPSWLYPVTQGATTIWEHWDGMRPDGTMWDTSMNSFNHYAYGSVVQWFYEYICGIQPSEKPGEAGFATIRLAPLPDKRLGFASASYVTPFGKLVSSWRYDGESDIPRFRFEIPDGVTAELVLGGSKRLLTGGTFEF